MDERIDLNSRKSINLIWQVDPDSMIETDWINFLFSDFEINSIKDQNLKVVLDNSIIVTNGDSINGIAKKQYINSFKLKGFCVGVIHLSDEYFVSPVDFYDCTDFVFRNFFRPDVMNRDHVYFIPMGHKRGYRDYISPKSISDRQYSWSFAGEVGGRLSRREMLRYANNISGGIAYVGQGYNNSKNLSFEGYCKLMSDTIFALSPGGNRCVETSRIYEAIEAGAIPIVEDFSKFNLIKGIFREVFKPSEFKKYKVWAPHYWRESLNKLFSKSYWIQVYGPNFPCPRCSDWRELEKLIATIDTEAKSQEIQVFWSEYKKSLKDKIYAVVTNKLTSSELSSTKY